MANVADSTFTNSTPTSDVAEPVPTKKERRLVLALCGLAFFVSYVITAGPAVLMTRTLDLPMIEAIVRVLYAPLILIIKIDVPILAPLIKAWVELFR